MSELQQLRSSRTWKQALQQHRLMWCLIEQLLRDVVSVRFKTNIYSYHLWICSYYHNIKWNKRLLKSLLPWLCWILWCTPKHHPLLNLSLILILENTSLLIQVSTSVRKPRISLLDYLVYLISGKDGFDPITTLTENERLNALKQGHQVTFTFICEASSTANQC